MADITAVVGALGGLKNAIDIARFLKDSKPSLDKAEHQLQLADLIHSLAEARVQLAEIQEVLREKEQRIKELEEAFQSKDSLIRERDALYDMGHDGKPVGGPYCIYCWEREHRKYHLHKSNTKYGVSQCAHCKNEYWVKQEEPRKASIQAIGLQY